MYVSPGTVNASVNPRPPGSRRVASCSVANARANRARSTRSASRSPISGTRRRMNTTRPPVAVSPLKRQNSDEVIPTFSTRSRDQYTA